MEYEPDLTAPLSLVSPRTFSMVMEDGSEVMPDEEWQERFDTAENALRRILGDRVERVISDAIMGRPVTAEQRLEALRARVRKRACREVRTLARQHRARERVYGSSSD